MGDDATPRRVLGIAAAIYDHDITSANKFGEIMQRRGVRVRNADCHCRAGDALAGQNGADFAIDEAGMQHMADRGYFAFLQ